MRILFTACPMYGHVDTSCRSSLRRERPGSEVRGRYRVRLRPPGRAFAVVAAWPVGPTHRDAGGGADADWMRYFAVSAEARAVDLVPQGRRGGGPTSWCPRRPSWQDPSWPLWLGPDTSCMALESCRR